MTVKTVPEFDAYFFLPGYILILVTTGNKKTFFAEGFS
jgi:hypothetical protein